MNVIYWLHEISHLLKYMFKICICPCAKEMRHEGVFVTLILDRIKWAASRFGCSSLGIYCIGDWLGPICALKMMAKIEIPSLKEKRSPVVHPITCRYID
jgi:hypothetical protein